MNIWMKDFFEKRVIGEGRDFFPLQNSKNAAANSHLMSGNCHREEEKSGERR